MLGPVRIGVIVIFLLLGLFSLSFSQEQLTITTYYPSPFGSYRDLSVTDSLQVGPHPMANAQGRVHTGGSNAEFSFARRDLAAPPAGVAGDRYVWYNQAGTAALWTPVSGNLVSIGSTGNVYAAGAVEAFSRCILLTFGGDTGQLNCPAEYPNIGISSDRTVPDGGFFYCCR